MKVEVKTKLVGVDTLMPATFQHYVDVQGQVDAVDNVMALQQIPGVVTQVLVSAGDRYSQGTGVVSH
jgi:multidrug efflux pump subunit AcrA (membrane-fusion protein)